MNCIRKTKLRFKQLESFSSLKLLRTQRHVVVKTHSQGIQEHVLSRSDVLILIPFASILVETYLGCWEQEGQPCLKC